MPKNRSLYTTTVRPAPTRTLNDARYDCGGITDILTTLGDADITGTHDLCGTSVQFLNELPEERLADIRTATVGTLSYLAVLRALVHPQPTQARFHSTLCPRPLSSRHLLPATQAGSVKRSGVHSTRSSP